MTAKMHRVHIAKVGESFVFQNGGTPYEVDAVAKSDLIGAYARFGNKGFVYARAGGTLQTYIGAKNSLSQKIGNSAIQANYAAGVSTITLTSAVSCTLDELKGGEVVVFVSTYEAFTRGIVGNPAMTATATLTLYLDSPIPVAITTSMTAEVMKNPYYAVTSTSDEWKPVMGMPAVAATIGQGVWLQVSGPSWVAPESEVGGNANYLEMCFGGDGALRRRDSGTPGEQRAGMLITTAVGANSQGAPFVMLNIDH